MTPSQGRLRARRLSLAVLTAALAATAARAQTITAVGSIECVGFPGAPEGARVIDTERLRGYLEAEIGRECDPPRISENLAARYRALGYVPTVDIVCDEGRLDARIRESSHRIGLVTFDPSDLAALGVKAASVEGEKPLYPIPAEAPRDVLRGLMQSRAGDLYNVERYRADRNALARLGYALLFIPDLPVLPDAYPEGALLIQSRSPLPEEGTAPERKRNYLGGTAGYGPRSGPSAGIVYQRNDIIKPYDRLTLSPVFNTAWGGTLQYSAPFVAERSEPRRLYDLGGSLYSTFQNNRFIDGVEQDERTNGASVQMGARPLGLAPRHDARFEASLRYEDVYLDQAPKPVGQAIVGFGMAHEYRHTWSAPSFTLRTTPSVECALGLGHDPAWIRPDLELSWHARLGAGFEGDVRFHGGVFDRPAPEFQLYTLGGVTTVRGYREDTWLGRGLVVTQSELWIPFARPLEARPIPPGGTTDPTAAPLEPRFTRRLKAALFFDAGTAFETTAGTRETLAGAGFGLRFVVPDQPLVIRLDYGWGLGPQGGDSFPYVSLGYHF
jgi:surface antigen Omp85-like protein